MKKVVYTAITGAYDQLIDPRVITPDFEYICFTNNKNLISRAWKIIHVEEPDLDNVRFARKIKILFHKYLQNADFSIWVDGNFTINCDLNKFLSCYYKGGDFATFEHPDRNCFYEEAKACIRLKKDNANLINKQVAQYQSEGFPKDFGMISSGLMIRKHDNLDIQNFMELWFDQVLHRSRRDQLSFTYTLWKHPIHAQLLPFNEVLKKYFLKVPHSSKR